MGKKRIQKFSQQKGGQRGRNMKAVKDMIDSLSGGESAAFLRAMINTAWANGCLSEIITERITPCLKALGEQYKKGPKHRKSMWLSLITGLVKGRGEAEKILGFTIDSKAWRKWD